MGAMPTSAIRSAVQSRSGMNNPTSRDVPSTRPFVQPNRRVRGEFGNYELSPAAQSYAGAVGNPMTGPLAGVPDYPVTTSAVRRFWAKGTASTSTNAAAAGFGFVMFDVERAMANNTAALFSNIPASILNTITDSTSANSQVVAQMNSPHALAAFGAGVTGIQYKIVGASLSVTNVTPMNQRGGTVTGIQTPQQSSLSGSTLGTVQGFEEADWFNGGDVGPTGSPWVTLNWAPITDNETGMQTVIPAANAANDATYLGFVFQASDLTGANPQTYAVEAYIVVELQGAPIPDRVPRHVDPTGFAAVQAAVKHSSKLRRPHMNDLSDVGKALANASHHYGAVHHSGHKVGPPPPHDGSSWWERLLGYVPSILSAAAVFL